MKCHSIGTPKRYRVVCKCKYFALNTLSGTKTQDFNPQEVWRASPPFLYGSPPRVLHQPGWSTNYKQWLTWVTTSNSPSQDYTNQDDQLNQPQILTYLGHNQQQSFSGLHLLGRSSKDEQKLYSIALSKTSFICTFSSFFLMFLSLPGPVLQCGSCW